MTLFTSIKIQTLNLCNRSCDFCAMSVLSEPEQRLDEASFEVIVGQLRRLGFQGRVTPFLHNEPLLDDRVPRFIRQLKDQLPAAFVSLTTNGDHLETDAVRRSLAASGLDTLRVNSYGSEGLHRRRLALLRRWERESESVVVTSSEDLHPRDGRLYVRPRWVPAVRPDFWNFAGSVSAVTPSAANQEHGCCSRPFEQLCINARGEAILCCGDWRGEVVLGHVLNSSLADLWESQTLRRYRSRHRRRRTRELPLCGSCNRIVHADPKDRPFARRSMREEAS